MYFHTQSSQNRASSSTSFQPPVVSHRVTSSEKDVFDAQAALAIFEGGMPLNTFDRRLKPAMYELVTNLNKEWKPPHRQTLSGKLMDERYETVKKKMDRALGDVNWMSFVTDGSDDNAKRRITNLSVNVPSQGTFYLHNWDSADNSQSAMYYFQLLASEFIQACGGDLSRMNSLATDTCSTMRRLYQIISTDPRFSYVFMVLCDSHGLQLLIEAIVSKHQGILDIMEKAQAIVAAFAHSKLQFAILRRHQTDCYGRTKELIATSYIRWSTQFGMVLSLL